MSDVERLHRIKYMIQARKCVPIEDFLEISDEGREKMAQNEVILKKKKKK